MFRIIAITLIIVVVAAGVPATAGDDPASVDAVAPACGIGPEDITIALGDGPEAEAMRAILRAYGPWVVEFLHEEFLAEGLDPERPDQAVRIAQWDRLFDQVTQQRYGRWSRLYWYTDLERAQQVAAAAEKPILSLHLLGDLTEERTCANSRLFRTILYADTATADLLREHFVLHWWSSMDVPEVTVDYGDGRVIRGTVTGNSLHYVLDADGLVIDAVPGLWSPAAFRERLDRSLALVGEVAALEASVRAEHLRERRAGDAGLEAAIRRLDYNQLAVQAEALSVSKSAMPLEMPVVRAVGLQPNERLISPQELQQRQQQAAMERRVRVQGFDANSRALVLTQLRGLLAGVRRVAPLDGPATARLSGDGAGDPTTVAVERLLAATLDRLAADTVLNRTSLDPRIQGILHREADAELTTINRAIYAEVFHTPHDDPWMGLAPHAAYTALAAGGLEIGEEPMARGD